MTVSLSVKFYYHRAHGNIWYTTARVVKELGRYQRGEPSVERYSLELLRRATLEGDPEVWEWVQYCFSDMVRGWLRRHPSRDTAMKLESEDNYIALTFARFWQSTTLNKKIEFRTLAAALQYLRASLHGTIIDTLRAYARPKEVSLLGLEETVETGWEDQYTSLEVWEVLKSLLPDLREQRLARLLYYCGLKPREIIRFCPDEWNDVQEIYCLRRKIMDRLLRRADQLGWKLVMSSNFRKDNNVDSKAKPKRRGKRVC
jgi:hypothetical protein